MDAVLCLGPHLAVPLRVCVLTSSYKDAIPIGSGLPCDPIYLNYLFKDTIPKYSHILRAWAQTLN